MTKNEALEKKAENARELGLMPYDGGDYEPEQEPVGWAEHGVINWLADKQFNHTSFLYDTPAQRTWVGLTDREIDELWMSHHDDFGNPLSATGYERAIEAKLKEKNK